MITALLPAETVDSAASRDVPQASMTLFGSLGDIEIHWEEHNRAKMREEIQKMMDRGVTFFQIKPTKFLRRKVEIKSMDELIANGVRVGDDNIAAVLALEGVKVAKTSGKIEQVGGIIRDAAVAASTHTVATPRPVGG